MRWRGDPRRPGAPMRTGSWLFRYKTSRSLLGDLGSMGKSTRSTLSGSWRRSSSSSSRGSGKEVDGRSSDDEGVFHGDDTPDATMSGTSWARTEKGQRNFPIANKAAGEGKREGEWEEGIDGGGGIDSSGSDSGGDGMGSQQTPSPVISVPLCTAPDVVMVRPTLDKTPDFFTRSTRGTLSSGSPLNDAGKGG
ncbi:unnamed protein product, partial [Discosporangium mesarthrocarpum]